MECLIVDSCENSGIGQTYWQVILGRIIAGCGASGMVSLASIIITGELLALFFPLYLRPFKKFSWRLINLHDTDIADPSDVAVLRSYVNIASTIGLSGGGPLGGFLAAALGWRW